MPVALEIDEKLRLTAGVDRPQNTTVMKPILLFPLVMALPAFAGTPATVTPPPPPAEQGITLGLEALYLRSYQSNGQYSSGDWDFGGRGSLGYQFSDGLFIKATYFGYGSDVQSMLVEKNNDYDVINAELDVSYLDLVVGQNFKPSETLTLSPYVGLRWGTFEESTTDAKYYYEGDRFKDGKIRGNDFSGLGIVIGVDATRTVYDPVNHWMGGKITNWIRFFGVNPDNWVVRQAGETAWIAQRPFHTLSVGPASAAYSYRF